MENEIKDPQAQEPTPIKIETIKGGPLAVFSVLEVKLADGTVVNKTGPRTSFCRCGASANKPFCDGAHKNIGWAE